MSIKHALRGLAPALGLLVAPSLALAHPHVWATVRSEILIGPNHQITGIRHAWTFDEFYTAMAVEGLDTNKDGVYSKEELQPLLRQERAHAALHAAAREARRYARQRLRAPETA